VVYTTNVIRRRIAPIAKKYQLRSVYLFGSYARNEATEGSDLDVLVDTTNSSVKGWIIGGLYNDLCEIFGENIDLVTMGALTQDEDDGRTPRFRKNIMDDRVLIYEQQ
jgi:predicted nucleotidyltransferase